MPDLVFTAGRTECPGTAASADFKCQVGGTLSIRGVAKPFALTLSARQSPAGKMNWLRAAGEAVVKLSDYAIAAPSQFGVSTGNEVKVKLSITFKREGSNAGGAQ